MSFDVYVSYPVCEHCKRGGDSAWQFNITHNVNSIVEACFVKGAQASGLPLLTGIGSPPSSYANRSWGRLAGHTIGEVKELLRAASQIAHSFEHVAEFHALEPENKWGSLDGVRERFAAFVQAIDRGDFEDHFLVDARG